MQNYIGTTGFIVHILRQVHTKILSTVNSDINPVIGISNFVYETIENEKKRRIFLLKPKYLGQYLREIRTIMNYSESSQFINEKLIKTDNTRLIGP